MGSGIIRACHALGLIYELSTPGAHETNAVAERSVFAVQDGMRGLRVRAGLFADVWPYAETCYAMCSNDKDMAPNQEDEPGMIK